MTRHVLKSVPGGRIVTEAQRNDPLFVQSVARAMQVLSAFHGVDSALSLAEIAKAAGIDRSAAQRIVHTLRQLGYLRLDKDGRGFLPDIRILDHTLDYLSLNPIVRNATPVLLELRRNAQERVDLSLFDDVRVVYAARMQSKRETFFATLVGHSVPTYCSSGGRAILSKLDDDEVRDIIARSDRTPLTPRTITDPERVMSKVHEAREQGFALAREEILIGEIALGVPIIGHDGRPCGAIHIAGSLSDWHEEAFRDRFFPLAAEAALAISRF
ncbi:helix-turn-helix domain-containing protein [Halomonas sp. LR3S48]|uniref:IclR family transcriptional regulator n=1 Tax=Halomonadaceae TaxID=28256 RepID=UPI0021E4BBB7|nr:IclR family transcriptional regulator C-terminal domain-containing protein [Halomonas sp. LR3S48]UYG02040.1 helix-turn-helix domain-containing protein [Halomonas sp. LR3S48]